MIRLKIMLAALSLFALTSPVLAQTQPPKTDGEQTKDETGPSPEEKKAFRARMEENVRQTLDPAYLPLLEAFAPFAQLGKQTLIPPYSSPLLSSVEFLKQPSLREGVTRTRLWLATFNGSDPNFQSSVSDDFIQEMMGFFYLMRGIIPLEMNWSAENRVALSQHNHEKLFKNLEERLRFTEEFQILDWERGRVTSQWNSQKPVLFAEALKGFTPKECDRLLILIERWEGGNGTQEIGLGNSMRQEIAHTTNMIQDDGSIYEEKEEPAEKDKMSEDDGKSDQQSTEDTSEKEFAKMGELLTSFFAAPKQPSLHPNAEALHKKQLLTASILEDYEQIYRLVLDPFAPLPTSRSPTPSRPDWIEKANPLSLLASFMAELAEIRKERLSLRLLTIHTRIRKFQWEHDRLPKNLSELGLGMLATAPVTHKPFRYRTDGDTYILTGSLPATDEDGNPKPKPDPFDLMQEPLPDFDAGFSLTT